MSRQLGYSRVLGHMAPCHRQSGGVVQLEAASPQAAALIGSVRACDVACSQPLSRAVVVSVPWFERDVASSVGVDATA